MVQDMTAVVIVASLIIAACSLAVNIAAGLGERKRPFSLLRLTDVPTGVLHRVVALESALPLLLVAAVSIVVGLVSAALYLHSQVGIAFRMPGTAYWATVVGGLAASLAIIASTSRSSTGSRDPRSPGTSERAASGCSGTSAGSGSAKAASDR